jgi:hypothetical protein
MKKLLFTILILISSYSYSAGLADLKFGRYQIADSQWNVSACMYSATCQIYSKNPGTAYKIPWTNGQLSWATGDYVAFVPTGNSTNPFNAIQYSANGTQKAVMGSGRIINMGANYFFFVGNDNNTGQLFSMTEGFANTAGLTWTGTLNPTVQQVNTYAANGSTTPLAPGQKATPAAPALCCGGSSEPFNANATNTAKALNFRNRTSGDSQVYIEQIGNFNDVNVNQQGTKNNYVKYSGVGNSNDVNINQSGNASTTSNYIDLTINGSNNSANITQQSTGGAKGAFVNINNNNNNVTLQQKDNGNHYSEINVIGGNKTIGITQQGSAAHMSNVTLSGNPSSLSLTQSGTTQQFYSINNNCATSGGCAAITVIQGQ